MLQAFILAPDVDSAFLFLFLMVFLAIRYSKDEPKAKLTEIDKTPSRYEINEDGVLVDTHMMGAFQTAVRYIQSSTTLDHLECNLQMVELFRMRFGKNYLYDDLYAELIAQQFKVCNLSI